MKIIIKQFFFYLMLIGYLNSNAQNTECPVFLLANDLAASNAEFKTIIKEPQNFKAWHILNKESPNLRTSIEELKLVSKNLNEITNAGGYLKWKAASAGAGSAFSHMPTSGVLITNNSKHGTFLVGSYPSDLQKILAELNYPKIQNVDFNFPVPPGQKFNLLNISDDAYNYWTANGGFFTKVNGPWIDAAVVQGHDIIVVSKMDALYNSPGVLSGFGKEIHRLEWKHGYRYNPTIKMMVPPSQANGLPTKTLQSEYTHN